MGVRWIWRVVALLGFVAFVASSGPTRAQGAGELTVLQNQVSRLCSQGKYAEVIPIAERYVALARQRHGDDQSAYAYAITCLAIVYHAQGRDREAEPLLTRALTIYENALGPDHPNIATALTNIAFVYEGEKRYTDAQRLLKRALSIREKTLDPDHAEIANALSNLAFAYEGEERYTEAEPLLKRALSIREKTLDPDHVDIVNALNNLAFAYGAQKRFAEVEPLLKRALGIRERTLGADQRDVGGALNNLAAFYRDRERYAEAEPLYKRALAISEKALGPGHPGVATALTNLAFVCKKQKRYAEAEPLYKRALGINEKALGFEHADVGETLNHLAFLYFDQGRYAEAEPFFKRSLAIREKRFGPDQLIVAQTLTALEAVYVGMQRYAEAEALTRRRIAIEEKALGPEHTQVGDSLNSLAVNLAFLQHRHLDAETIFRRVLVMREKALGPTHPAVAVQLNTLAGVLESEDRYAEAESLLKRALVIREAALALDDPDVADSLRHLGANYQRRGRLAEALPLYQRAHAIFEKTLGPDHPHVLEFLLKFAKLYESMGLLAQAEPFYKHVLEARIRTLPPSDKALDNSFSELALLYRDLGRPRDEEQLYKRRIALAEGALGPDDPYVARTIGWLVQHYLQHDRPADAKPLAERALMIEEKAAALHPDHIIRGMGTELAQVYRAQGRFDEEEALYKRLIATYEKVIGSEDQRIADWLTGLAGLYKDRGRYAEVERLLKRALAINEKALGQDNVLLVSNLDQLATFYRSQGRDDEAQFLFTRSLGIREKRLATLEKEMGPDADYIRETLSPLVGAAWNQNDLVRGVDYERRVAEITIRRAKREGVTSNTKSELLVFKRFEQMIHALAQVDATRAPDLGREGFAISQWAQYSAAGASLGQMSIRLAKGDPAIAKLIRERQDLVAEWRVKDKQLVATKSVAPIKRNSDAEKSLSDRLTAIDARLAAIDTQLEKEFPEYASLTSLNMASVAEVQAQLRDNEVLVAFLDTPDFGWKDSEEDKTFIWAISKDGMRWVRGELGTKALTEVVAALRCGLDAALWYDEPAAARCRSLVKAAPERDANGNVRVETLPFDFARAHELYKALIGPVEDMIKGGHLLIVPSGPLTSLPFNVLVTEPPKQATGEYLRDYRGAGWLGARVAMTVLPSVASLKALRQFAKTSHASKPYLGIGDPLLDGPQNDRQWGAYYKERAELASRKRCSQMPNLQQLASARGPRSVRGFASMFRGIHADIEDVRAWSPLPETADELCEVARRLGVPDREVLLGSDATEGRLKDLSEEGRLADYAILHFATHGALNGDVEGVAEPGLILTPPTGTKDTQGLERDDGFLTASEIATLNLDADWVILSACNTAGAQGEGSEALSGMARAFFYAGARALLVSHWAVASDATVNLITGAVERMAADKRIGRAEAMRQAMLALIDRGKPYEAHPAFWAPFVVVGEGAP